jgi:hypothetical protein
MNIQIHGNHEVVTVEPQDLRSLKFTHIKQRGAFILLDTFQENDLTMGLKPYRSSSSDH